jgi:hypothetical protein
MRLRGLAWEGNRLGRPKEFSRVPMKARGPPIMQVMKAVKNLPLSDRLAKPDRLRVWARRV